MRKGSKIGTAGHQGGKHGDAVPIYEAGGTTYTVEFQEYIDDALDLIEFANGDENTEWGKKRIDMGHTEPFNLTMIGIGNEQWRIGENNWYARYEAFEKEIHAQYPDIKLIGTSGPSADGVLFDEAWSWIREKQADNSSFVYAVDEHYYMSPEWFLENDHRYDHYDRNAKVFAGEYAAHTTLTGEAIKKNNLESAIAEAAFMTGLERNADVVYMASYAPLLARVGYTQWHPDLIWFDDAESYCSPNYYVQKMYASNNGTYTLKTGVVNDEKVYQTVSYDAKTGDVIVKIANPDEFEHKTKITLDNSFTPSGTAEQQLLKGNEWTDSNSIEEPDKIATVTNEINFVNGGDYIVPAKSFVVLRIHTTNKAYVALTEFSNKDGKLSYKLATGKDYDADTHDISVKISDIDGNSVDTLTELSGSVDIDNSKEYKIEVMVYDKSTTNLAEGFTPIIKTTMDNSVYKLASYTTNGAEYHGVEKPIIGNSLHLAVSQDGGKSYEPLNSNDGVLFAETDYTQEGGNPYKGVNKMLRSPYLFKMSDGKYGVITARADGASDTDSTDGKAMLYTSDDLTVFEFFGYLELDSEAIYEPMCKYENDTYTISWSNEKGGSRKSSVTADFTNLGSASPTEELYTPPTASAPHLTETTNVLNLTKSEYDKLIQSLNAPVNTGIQEFEDVTVEVNGTPSLPERATATYNDGSTQDYNVEWNTSGLDTSAAGTYTVQGTIETKDYTTDFIPNRADPCILKFDNKYYFVATRDSGGQTVLNIRVADSIDGIAAAKDNELLSGSDLIWAPEIHNVDGKLMIFFATGRAWNYVQSHVMVLNENSDAAVKENWSQPERIMKQDDTANLIDNGITLDMTAFNWGNKWYYSWSQRITDTRAESGTDYGFESANIYIAEFDPTDPTKLTSDTAVISKPIYGWERTTAEVDEGPFTIVNDSKLYMTIATNGTNTSYGIKLLTLKENGNPLNPQDWTAKGYPILATAMNTSEPGPGHSSFTVDENGDPVLVYHWGRSGGGRTTTVKNVHFNTKGESVLNIPRGEQVKNKNVLIRVIVR